MISIITDPVVGGTFLNWSIHYLSGDLDYYFAWHDSLLPVCSDPLTDKNAHGFMPNQSSTLADFCTVLNKLKQSSRSNNTLYFHHFRGATLSDDPDTKQAVVQVNTLSTKTVFLTLAPEHALYKCSYEQRTSVRSWIDKTKTLHSNEEIFKDFVNQFFADSKFKWEQLDLNQIWDLREFLALNFDPFNIISIRPMVGLIKTPSYIIEAVEMMTVFDQTVYDLFDYLQIKLCDNRFSHWLTVYRKWQKIHLRRLKFVFNYQLIVNSVVNGSNVDLSKFDLDIIQEAAIQRALIYNHGLNFKTWQLEKFTNTAQLHHLLQPNFHPL
jgi:hypothetical protein